jgi:hypothetical protein
MNLETIDPSGVLINALVNLLGDKLTAWSKYWHYKETGEIIMVFDYQDCIPHCASIEKREGSRE